MGKYICCNFDNFDTTAALMRDCGIADSTAVCNEYVISCLLFAVDHVSLSVSVSLFISVFFFVFILVHDCYAAHRGGSRAVRYGGGQPLSLSPPSPPLPSSPSPPPPLEVGAP